MTNTAAIVVAVIAFVAAVWGVLQKWHTDRRDQWWKRVQWGFDHCHDADPLGRIARRTLYWAQLSPLAHNEEIAMMADIAKRKLTDPTP